MKQVIDKKHNWNKQKKNAFPGKKLQFNHNNVSWVEELNNWKEKNSGFYNNSKLNNKLIKKIPFFTNKKNKTLNKNRIKRA